MEIVAKDNLILATVRIEPPYPATTISGKTWMAVNMSGDDGLGGISSYTWDNDWGTQYYYTLSAAKRIAASMYPGWHVPTKDEWNDLSAALYLTYIDPDYPPEYVHTRPGTALGDVMRGQDGWARAKTAYTDINVFSALPVDNYWFTHNNEWTYPSAYSGECYFIADDPTANSALHYTVENMYESVQTRLSAQYRPFEGYNRDAHLGAEMNSVRLVLDSTAQNTGRPVIDKIYCVMDPYNPLNLPPNTIRLRYREGITLNPYHGTATQISVTPNIWDLTYNNNDWSELLSLYSEFDTHPEASALIEVLGANTKNVTSFSDMFNGCSMLTGINLFNTCNAIDMFGMFYSCQSLSTVPLFNTDNVTNIEYMFGNCIALTSVPYFNTQNVTSMTQTFASCSSLKTIPLFNTNKVVNMDLTFSDCRAVESGALALYQQVSTQATPPSLHDGTFYNCGINTVQGAAELAQIPSDWK